MLLCYHSLVRGTIMANILIRRVREETKRLLRRRAARHGKSLEAELRETLDRVAREETSSPDEAAPFGSWLVPISRPSADLDEAIDAFQAVPTRPAAMS
jgi:antitoxin FitA